jgi:hypothetical protein
MASLCVLKTRSELHQWPSGWRYCPPPDVCEGTNLRGDACGKPADGLLSWHGRMGLLFDFAGCMTCASTRRAQIEAEGYKVRASRLGSQ